ncbi:rhomboid family intramembrane serine protease [Flavobacterium sp.]
MDNIALYLLIGVNAIISFKGFEDQYFFNKYKFNVGAIRAGEQIRMVSSGFLHADIGHLAFNMITLYFFAPIVAQSLGVFPFLLIYFASLVCGSLLTMMFHGNDNSYSAVGASGAVTGVLYSAILMYPEMTLGIFGIIPMPAYLFGIGYLLYSIYGMRAKRDNIGHTAHIGGAIGGYVITLLKVPSLLQDNLLMVILLAIPIVLLFVLAKAGKL